VEAQSPATAEFCVGDLFTVALVVYLRPRLHEYTFALCYAVRYRNFQMSDGMCVCAPNYEFIDADLVARSEADGAQDCQPIAYKRCAQGEKRNALGRCVSADCASTTKCSVGISVWEASLGLCTCPDDPSLQVRFCVRSCHLSTGFDSY
jgi:hypothetical protein